MFSRIVENAVHKKEIPHLRLAKNFFDFLNHRFRRTQPVAPAFELRINAVAAFERTAALGLHADKSAAPRVARIVAQVVGRRRQFAELRDWPWSERGSRCRIFLRGDDAVNACERQTFFQAVKTS